MKRPIKVLITGGGSPGIAATIHALRNNYDNRPIRIVTVDARDNVVGKYLSDKFYKIPMYNEENFIASVLDICISEGIDIILPQVTRELGIFASNKKIFEDKGTKIALSSKRSIDLSNNKYLLMKEFVRLGYEQGKFRLISTKEELYDFANECGYPNNNFVVKLPLSNGMRGLRIIREEKMTFDEFVNQKPNGIYSTLNEIVNILQIAPKNFSILGMEYFGGPEYSVDVYRSPLSKKIVAIPRIRSLIRTGITFEGELVKNDTIIEMSKRLSESLNMEYCFGFQYKLDDEGNIRLLESNPRIQGTMIMSVLAGANMIYWSVIEALGEEALIDESTINWNTRFKRYWGGMAIIRKQIHKIC